MEDTATWRTARAKLASLTAAHAPAEEIEAARAEFRSLITEDRITELAAAPELTAGQRRRLAALLNGGGAS